MKKKPLPTYNAHETERMHALDGVTLASFKSRAGAFVIDFILSFILWLLILVPGMRFAKRMGVDTAGVNLTFDLEHWYSFVVIVIFFALSTYWGNGKTPGKRLFGIRVVSLKHDRMTLWQSLERALGYGASLLEFGFGFIQYFIDANHRTVHDRIAETIVVRDNKNKES